MMMKRVLLAVVGLLVTAAAASAGTKYVPSQYPTIQSAVNASAPGDTIVVAAGVYSEHVVISTDSVTIRGVNRDTVIIDATQTPPARSPGIYLSHADGCTICSLTVRNGALGYPSGDVDNSQYGILLYDSDNNLITNVRTSNNGAYEIFLWDGSDNNVIQYCTIDGYRDSNYQALDGIFSSGGSVAEGGHNRINTGNLFRCNSIDNVVFGVSLTASADTQILGNTIHAKTSPFWALPANGGYYSYGVNLFASSNNEVRDNSIDTPALGVRLRDPQAGNSYIYAGPPDDNLITGNMINLTPASGLYGVAIRGGSNNDIERNEISQAATAGVAFTTSPDNATTGNSIFGNDIHDNAIGIDTPVGTNSAHYNNIHGNATLGVNNSDAANAFDAKNNWWGASDGPGPVGPGSGDGVSAFVDYTPFLTASVPKANVSLQLEGAATGPIRREITFHLMGTGPFSPTTIYKYINFTSGSATVTLFGLPANTAFSCMDAKDELHGLVSTKTIKLVSGNYTVPFTGADKLLGGDLLNDDVDDVWDFGIFAAQYQTICHPYAPGLLDADISGDGTVGNEDFLILYSHFQTKGDPPCGMTAGQLPAPKSKITVSQLAAVVGGAANARKADLNQDGWVTTTDAELFYLRNILNRR